MNRTLLAVALATGLFSAGCGNGPGRVKGKLVENGQPMSFPAMQVAIEFSLLGPDGEPISSKLFSAVVTEDGSFEVVASKGEVPPGTYRVGILGAGKFKEQMQAFETPVSPIRREIKPGLNNFTIDVARPQG